MLKLITSDYIDTLISLVQYSKHEILVCSYIITPPKHRRGYAYNGLFFELLLALQRNVEVRFLCDAGSSSAAVRRSVKEFTLFASTHKIPFRLHSFSSKLHAKFVVVDGLYSIIGSHNFTSTATRSPYELSILIDEPTISCELLNYYNHLWSLSNEGY